MRRSKAHWGYDAAFMGLAARTLRLEADDMASGDVRVAEDADGTPLGVCKLAAVDAATADLTDLFVEPRAIGAGIGRALLAWAADEARRRGLRRLTILADPNAAPFYERAGARFVRMAPSDAIPGRELPLYALDLG